MIRILVLSTLLMLTGQIALAQEKTHAFFMVGSYASPDWEKLEFNQTPSGSKLTYAYRQKESGIPLRPIGSRLVGGQRVLLVQLPNVKKPYMIQRDRASQQLVMTSQDGTYRKSFRLGYEGPVDGRGTYCATCANEPADAFRLVDAYFASVR